MVGGIPFIVGTVHCITSFATEGGVGIQFGTIMSIVDVLARCSTQP